ncbi:MAG: EAL domain-containing protein [Sphingomonadaceae bacterium]|uniref:sensor domain-containing protein n=1 Tax=Thermaurantiacus sp. TaxID=2820283 RepID=UPI00298F3CC4|nr:EAL domain-containing protein [Thermaurantiacus sp.]MCS6986351.1 EAL domain-containing protein [Sphingomonadaceae bacterium]MDW8414387.1 EAL domain-containing protein [Thermaurantiacus sp.]
MRHFRPQGWVELRAPKRALRAVEPLFEAARLGTWCLDLRSGDLWWSRQTCRFHEVPIHHRPDLADAIAFYEPEAQERIRAAIAQAEAHGTPWDVTLPIRTARGRRVLLHSCGLAAAGPDGVVAFLLGICADVTEARARADEHERLALVVRQMRNAAVVADAQGVARWANPAFEALSGIPQDQVVGRGLTDLWLGPEAGPERAAALARAIDQGTPFHGEVPARRADGTSGWIELSLSPIRDSQGGVSGHVAIGADCTDRREAQEAARRELEARRRAETLLREIIDAVPVMISAYDAQDRFILGNRALAQGFPHLADVFQPGCPLELGLKAWHQREFGAAAKDPRAIAALNRGIEQIRRGVDGLETRMADGRWLLSSSCRAPSGTLTWVRTDITALKNAELEARQLASRDPLTGLLNRAGFLEALGTALRKSASPAAGCLLVIDVDHFKSVNDCYGHEAGDGLLRAVAARLRRAIRRSDHAARLGGDEFALFLPGLDGAEARRRAEAILTAGSRSVRLAGLRIQPSLSMGAALVGPDVADGEALLRRADRALYEAKRQGRGCVVFYADRLAEELAGRRRLAERLRRALVAGRIEVHLQPQLRVADGRIDSFEALARWTDAGTPVPPLEFVAAAEEHGLARRLGRAVLERALAACRRLRARAGRPLRIGVNVSTAQLLDDDFAPGVLQLVEAAGLPPDALEVEITETVLLDRSFARISRSLATLHAAGIRLMLDDFGTGHASLSHLSALAVDGLKIDRSFVAAIGIDRRRETVARAMVSLARSLGLDCVAEGVETRAQWQLLEQAGCHRLQGFLIGRPVPEDEALAMLAPAALALAV